MPEDFISIQILDDGRIKSETDTVSPANHSAASDFFRLLEEITGGKAIRQRRNVNKQHIHQHAQEKQK